MLKAGLTPGNFCPVARKMLHEWLRAQIHEKNFVGFFNGLQSFVNGTLFAMIFRNVTRKFVSKPFRP